MDQRGCKSPCPLRASFLSSQILLLPSPLPGLHHGGGLSRLSEPTAPGQGAGRHLRGAVPQLHSRAFAAAFLPADLRLHTGEIPRGMAGRERGPPQGSAEGMRPDRVGVWSSNNLWLHPVWPTPEQSPNSRPGSPGLCCASFSRCFLAFIHGSCTYSLETPGNLGLPTPCSPSCPFFGMTCSSLPTSPKRILLQPGKPFMLCCWVQMVGLHFGS